MQLREFVYVVAIIIHPHPVVATVAVNIFESHAADVTHAFSSEALSERLPVCWFVFNPSIPPTCDIAIICQNTVIGSTITVNISQTHMLLIVLFWTLPQSNIGKGGRLVTPESPSPLLMLA
jgi:hypothetical protein